jgi:hypothetical protein
VRRGRGCAAGGLWGRGELAGGTGFRDDRDDDDDDDDDDDAACALDAGV